VDDVLRLPLLAGDRDAESRVGGVSGAAGVSKRSAGTVFQALTRAGTREQRRDLAARTALAGVQHREVLGEGVGGVDDEHTGQRQPSSACSRTRHGKARTTTSAVARSPRSPGCTPGPATDDLAQFVGTPSRGDDHLVVRGAEAPRQGAAEPASSQDRDTHVAPLVGVRAPYAASSGRARPGDRGPSGPCPSGRGRPASPGSQPAPVRGSAPCTAPTLLGGPGLGCRHGGSRRWGKRGDRVHRDRGRRARDRAADPAPRGDLRGGLRRASTSTSAAGSSPRR
jgi:hypothetical protein